MLACWHKLCDSWLAADWSEIQRKAEYFIEIEKPKWEATNCIHRHQPRLNRCIIASPTYIVDWRLLFPCLWCATFWPVYFVLQSCIALGEFCKRTNWIFRWTSRDRICNNSNARTTTFSTRSLHFRDWLQMHITRSPCFPEKRNHHNFFSFMFTTSYKWSSIDPISQRRVE